MEITPPQHISEDTSSQHVHEVDPHPVIAGKRTAPGHIVHYTDHEYTRHAARIEHLSGSVANLHVLHAHGDAKNTHEFSVSHSATGAPHSWTHLPE